MHSERLGKTLAGQRRALGEGGKRNVEAEPLPNNIVYFSIKPMTDKSRTPGLREPDRPVRERKTTQLVPDCREDFFLPDKYSAWGPQEAFSASRPQISKYPLHTEGNKSQVDCEVETGRSYRILNQFFAYKEESATPSAHGRVPLTLNEDKHISKPIQRFAFTPADTSKKNSSMISSKSYEVLDALNRHEHKSPCTRLDELQKNKTLANFNRILENSKTIKSPSRPPEVLVTGVNKESLPTTSPDDSYIFRQGERIPINSSPSHSIIKRPLDKSKVSALNRSDISKNSNGNSSFLTRRDEGDLSRMGAQAADSNNRGGMSKTWVKSGLLDSREEISTIKNPKGRLLDKSAQQDRSAYDYSEDKSTKKRTLYEEIENMFTRELNQNSKESTCSSSKATEYELQKCIGQGAYAKVYKALHIPSKTKVAVKLYEKSKLTEKLRQKSIKREIKILSRLNHPNVVNFIDCFSTKNHIYLVMELVRGLSLYELLKKQPERKIKESNAKTIIKQIIKALVYCHSKCVSHRDIKLENVIISSTGEVKVIDFGFSTCIPNDKKVKMFCGTPSYMAPEIANKTEYCGPPVDVWATGVLFFVLVSGKFPFKGSTDKKLYNRISTNDPLFETPISEEARTIILQMMSKSADDRPSTTEVL